MDSQDKDPNKIAAGLARAKSLSAEDRSAIARKAALTRHRKQLPKAIAEGVLKIGDVLLPCAVLDDANNSRVLSQNGFLRAMGRHPRAAGGTGSAVDNIPPFLKAKNLKPFISSELERSMVPILYLPRNPSAGSGGIGYGNLATLLPDVCWVYQDAMTAGKLAASQLHIAEACKLFLKALTNHAIEDLVDRATGFDDLRKREAINRILDKYVRSDALPWVKMFDIDFYRQIYRLNRWPFDPDKTARPGIIGHWTNDLYDRLAPMIRPELHRLVRRNANGKPIEKLTQHLSPEEGKPRLRELLEGVKALMRVSTDWEDYTAKLDVAFPRFDETITLPFEGGLRRLQKPV